MDSLPNETFRLILSFLSAQKLILGKRCCKRWKIWAEDILENDVIRKNSWYSDEFKYKEFRIGFKKGQQIPFSIKLNLEKYKIYWDKLNSEVSTYIYQDLGIWERRETPKFHFPFFLSFEGRITIYFDKDKNIREIQKDARSNRDMGTMFTFFVEQSDKGTSWISNIISESYNYTFDHPCRYPVQEYIFPNKSIMKEPDIRHCINKKQIFINLLTIRNYQKHRYAFCLIKPRKNRFMIRKKFLEEYKVPDFGVVPQMML